MCICDCACEIMCNNRWMRVCDDYDDDGGDNDEKILSCRVVHTEFEYVTLHISISFWMHTKMNMDSGFRPNKKKSNK